MRARSPAWLSLLAASLALDLAPAAAGTAQPNPAAGAHLSITCAACHGNDGFSVDTSIPNLAGQHYVYLVQQLNAFKTGSRISPLMNELARPLTKEQIEDISAYYAGVPVEVAKPSAPKRQP
jgi:cytochrome c553